MCPRHEPFVLNPPNQSSQTPPSLAGDGRACPETTLRGKRPTPILLEPVWCIMAANRAPVAIFRGGT